MLNQLDLIVEQTFMQIIFRRQLDLTAVGIFGYLIAVNGDFNMKFGYLILIYLKIDIGFTYQLPTHTFSMYFMVLKKYNNSRR